MSYLIHSALLLAACYLYYRFVLRRETHFRLHRFVLLGCIAACFLLPLVTVPASLSVATALAISRPDLPETHGIQLTPALSHPVNTPVNMARGVTDSQSTGVDVADRSTKIGVTKTGIDWLRLTWLVYLGGVGVFTLHFLFQLAVLRRRVGRGNGYEVAGCRIVELDKPAAPHSFWNYVFVYPADYDSATYQNILDHERIHVRQRHSIDLLLAELLIVVQWCNPFAWVYRRAIENNLEYLTDAEVLRQGTDPVNYQLSLLRVAVPGRARGLVTHYNTNFLEQRIMMMKAKRSSARSGWKYLALPALLLCSLSSFNAIAQEPPVPPAAPTSVEVPRSVEVSVPVNAPVVQPAPSPVPVPAPNPTPAPIPPAAPTPAPAPRLNMNLRAPTDTKIRRSWTAEVDGGEVCMAFIETGDRGNYQMNTNHCFTTAELGDLPRGAMGDFSLTRTAGTLSFRGLFEGNTGLGTYEFAPAPAFTAELERLGFGSFDDQELVHFFFTDITPEYLAYLRDEYDPTHDELVQVAVFGIDRATLTQVSYDLEEAGFGNPGLEKIVQLRIFGVNRTYFDELAAAGYEGLELDDVIQAKIHGLGTDFIRQMAALGFEDLDFDEVIQLSVHDIDAEYVQELKSLGYEEPTSEEIVAAKIHGVRAQKIREFREAGLSDLSLEEAREASIHGITKEYIAELATLGFADLGIRDIIDAKIHGVNASKAKEMMDLGLEIDGLEDLKAFSIHGVTPELVGGLRDLGYTELETRDFIDARIHGITPDFVTSYTDLGYGQIPFRTLFDLSIHNVTPAFIRDNRREGDSLRDMIDYRIIRHARR